MGTSLSGPGGEVFVARESVLFNRFAPGRCFERGISGWRCREVGRGGSGLRYRVGALVRADSSVAEGGSLDRSKWAAPLRVDRISARPVVWRAVMACGVAGRDSRFGQNGHFAAAL